MTVFDYLDTDNYISQRALVRCIGIVGWIWVICFGIAVFVIPVSTCECLVPHLWGIGFTLVMTQLCVIHFPSKTVEQLKIVNVDDK